MVSTAEMTMRPFRRLLSCGVSGSLGGDAGGVMVTLTRVLSGLREPRRPWTITSFVTWSEVVASPDTFSDDTVPVLAVSVPSSGIADILCVYRLSC